MSVARRDLANAVRALPMDAVERANSGHPGAPMGMSDIAEVLWNDFLEHNPANPTWANRDRFVPSNGHGSMLLYALLHLSGYQLPIEEIKRFRQLHSMTPGHPEYRDTPGRFAPHGWHVIPRVDGHDAGAVKKAIEDARADSGRPSEQMHAIIETADELRLKRIQDSTPEFGNHAPALSGRRTRSPATVTRARRPACRENIQS